MESITPGFIAQLKVDPIKQHYRADKIFLDHYSDLTYVHLQRGLSSEETAEAKKSFENHARTYKVKIKHYHADNGRFAENAFIQAVTQESQTIICCGLNSCFQNGKAEKHIRDIQEQTRKQIHHAKSRFPKRHIIVTLALCTEASKLHYKLPSRKVRRLISIG